MNHNLWQAWRDFWKEANTWLKTVQRQALESAFNKVFAIDKRTGLIRVYLRDTLFFGVIAVVLIRHWDMVSHTGFEAVWGLVNGSVLAKLLGVIAFPMRWYVIKLMLVFLMPDSLRILLPVFLPYLLGWYVASRYVEDVFEISDALKSSKEGLKVAQEFLLRAAFAHSYGRVREKKTFACRLLGPLRPMICPTEKECLSWGRSRKHAKEKISLIRRIWDFVRGAPVGCPHTLAIVGGEVKDRRSPMLLIGGPGYVFISADSAALFERPDGAPHVVGPTLRRLELLEGFERLRRIVSLREHQVSFDIQARSRDGIPVEVNEVQILFGIFRGGRQPTPKEPFPFFSKAVERLVYGEMASQAVAFDRWERLSSSRVLTNTMRVMARSELSRFIRSQTVVEFLASVSPGDVDALEENYRQLAREIAPPTGPNGHHVTPPVFPNVPDFVPRYRIAERFDIMANGPDGALARGRGVGLQWIGLGAWHTPIEKVIKQHEQAWQLSVTNITRSSPVVLRDLERQRRFSAFAEYVRELLGWFQSTEEEAAETRESALLRYFLRRMEVAALMHYGGVAHAPARWRGTMAYLRALIPHDVNHKPDSDDDSD